MIAVQVVPLVDDCQATVGAGEPAPAAVSVTVLPTVTVWLTGAKVTLGATTTVKFVAEVAVSEPLMMLIVPAVAPTGTTAVTLVADTTVNVVADTPLNLTPVVPVKFVPVIVTVAPTAAEAGVNEVKP